MKPYPKHLRERWESLSYETFDPNSELAQSFVKWPASVWTKVWVGTTKASALGCALRGSSYASRSQNVLSWVDHLLRCGASVDMPLFKPQRSRNYYLERTLRQQAWEDSGPELLALAHSHGMALFEKFSFVSFRQVAEKGRLDWLKQYLDLDYHISSVSVESLLSCFLPPPKLLPALETMLEHQVKWSGSDQGLQKTLVSLWVLALTHPEPNYLQWAKRLWDEHPPTEPPEEWGERLGLQLQFGILNGDVKAVRAALEERIAPEQRGAWGPRLVEKPCRKDDVMGQSWDLNKEQWQGVLNVISWAIDWGLPPRQRTNNGVPWGLFVARSAYKSYGMFSGRSKDILAWQCLEMLVLDGHITHLKVLKGKKRSSQALCSPTTPEVFFGTYACVDSILREYSLPFEMQEWKGRLERAKLARRLLVATQPTWEAAQQNLGGESEPAPKARKLRM